jgi:hypothetical protein
MLRSSSLCSSLQSPTLSSQVQLLSSIFCSQISAVSAVPLTTKFQTHIKLNAKHSFVRVFAQSKNCRGREQPLLCNGCVTSNNVVTVGSGVFCGVLAEAVPRGPAAIMEKF